MALTDEDNKKCRTFLLNASDEQLRAVAEWSGICVDGKGENLGQYLWDQMDGDGRMLKELLGFIEEKYESSTPVQEVKDAADLESAVADAFGKVLGCIEKIYNYYTFYVTIDSKAEDTARFSREAQQILSAQYANCKQAVSGGVKVNSGVVNNLVVACSVRELDGKFKALANYNNIVGRDYIGNGENPVKKYAGEYEECLGVLNTINQQATVTRDQLSAQERQRTGGLGSNIGDSAVADATSPKVKGSVNTADKVAKWSKTELKDQNGETYTVGPEAEDVSIEAGNSYQFQNTKLSNGKGDYSEASHMPGFYEVGMVKPAVREGADREPVDYNQLHLYHFDDFTDDDYEVILKDNDRLFKALIHESHVAPAVKDLLRKWYDMNKHSKAYHRYLGQLLTH